MKFVVVDLFAEIDGCGGWFLMVVRRLFVRNCNYPCPNPVHPCRENHPSLSTRSISLPKALFKWNQIQARTPDQIILPPLVTTAIITILPAFPPRHPKWTPNIPPRSTPLHHSNTRPRCLCSPFQPTKPSSVSKTSKSKLSWYPLSSLRNVFLPDNAYSDSLRDIWDVDL